MTPVPTTIPSEHPLPRVVLTDVDDTLTWEGRLPSVTLAAMERLAAAGIALVPVTGACAGWCDQIARTWPVSAVIGENGAFTIEREGRHLRYRDWQDEATRMRHQAWLQKAAATLLRQYPGLRLALDNAYRRCDLALDHAQEVVPPVRADTVREAVAAAHALGVQATASSIHINLWLGDFSKKAASLAWVRRHHGWTPDQAPGYAAFVGDSLNDAQMFETFRRSVGVANIRPHLAALPVPPAHITQAPGGLGFAEWVNEVLLPC